MDTQALTGDAEYDPGTRCYYVEEGDWDCDQLPGLFGKWEGHFCPSADTADGTWWATSGINCNGDWWGSLAD